LQLINLAKETDFDITIFYIWAGALMGLRRIGLVFPARVGFRALLP